MFKPVHTVQGGALQSDIISSDIFAVFDFDTYMALVYALGSVDHTYVKFGTGRISEVVKVSNPVSSLTEMERGKDGTSARPWPAGTPVEYIFCADAVTDMIAQNPLPTAITLTSDDQSVMITDKGGYVYDLSTTFYGMGTLDDTIEIVEETVTDTSGTTKTFYVGVNKAALIGCPSTSNNSGGGS